MREVSRFSDVPFFRKGTSVAEGLNISESVIKKELNQASVQDKIKNIIIHKAA